MSGKYALIIGNTEYIDTGLAQLTAPGSFPLSTNSRQEDLKSFN
jgi:hypothetical protein